MRAPKEYRLAPGHAGTAPGVSAGVIHGYASVFDEWTTLHEGRNTASREVVRRGAFARAIREGQDTKALVDHSSALVLGRVGNGTLKLREDSHGLAVEITPNMASQYARDIVASLKRGDLCEMSFAFSPRRKAEATLVTRDGTTWEDFGGDRVTMRREGKRIVEERELIDVELYDVSVVAYPAYPGTSVGVRSGRRLTRGEMAASLRALQLRLMEGRMRGLGRS